MKTPADFYFSMNDNFYQVILYMFPTDIEHSIVFSVRTKAPPISNPFSNLRVGGWTDPTQREETRGANQ